MRRPDSPQTLLTLVVGLIVCHILSDQAWLLYTALGLGLGGVVSAGLGRMISAGWMCLGRLLGRIVSPLLLGLVFFLLLWPLAAARRLFRRDDPLALHDQRDSLFVATGDPYTPECFDRRW